MLRMILGRDWLANRDKILSMMAEDVALEAPGRILMVPELISHDMERRLCQAAGDTTSRFAEVLSFSRLARRVSEYSGNKLEDSMDAGGRIVAMASASRQLSSRLKAYAALETKPEFLNQLVDAVDEFKRCCISPADLLDASKRTEGSLAQKLEELSLLLETYDSLCVRGHRDPRDQMTLLLHQLQENEFAQDHVFYVDGFPDFTRQHLLILEHLILHSPSVTISLCCNEPGNRALSFEKPGETASQILRMARRHGIDVEILRVEGRNADALRPLRYSLFQGTIHQDPSLAGNIYTYRCDSVMQECAAAAQEIQRLVRRGCRYRDIAVVCPDMTHYRGPVSLFFNRLGIPSYLSGTEDILSKSVIHTVLCALDAAVEGLEQEAVLRYIKSVLSPLTPEQGDELESYVLTWNITGKQWAKQWQYHPDGLSMEWTEAAKHQLNRLNDLRATGVMPLVDLQEALKQAGTLGEHVLALYSFLEEIGLAQRMDRLAKQMDAQGDNRTAQELNQLWEILLCALEQLYDVLGDTYWSTETFSRLLKLLLGNYDVGTIPPVLDAVTVGPVSAMRCQECKHLVVLGVLEGSYPGYAGVSGVLSDQERTQLRDLGVPLTGGSLDKLKTEYSEIYGCFCGATESVRLFVPAGQEAHIYKRVCSLLGKREGELVTPLPLVGDSWDAGAFLARYKAKENAEELSVLDGYRDARHRAEYSLGNVSREHIVGLYGNKLRLSASQIDRHADCRLYYFLEYGLRAREQKTATVDPAEFGSFVHWVLENTAREIRDLGGFPQVTLEQTLAISQRYAAEYAQEHFSQLESSRVAYLLERNSKELCQVVEDLWEELHRSQFAPEDFEVKFDADGAMEAVQILGGTLEAEVRGFVDRVDVWHHNDRNYFRVVDYKTGRKDFDYCDVFNGVGLQMLLYMFALEQGGQQIVGEEPVPAGVQYFPARDPYVSADGKLSEDEADQKRVAQRRRRGLLLRDEDVLQAMESGDQFYRLPCNRRKDGSITGDLATAQQLKALHIYVQKYLAKMVTEIASGKIAANPYTRGSAHDACAFCPYSAVCRETAEDGRRNYKAMTPDLFWTEVEKEAKLSG